MANDFTFASRIGFGASGIGTLYRDVPEAMARETLETAYEAGIRYFDTAPLSVSAFAASSLSR